MHVWNWHVKDDNERSLGEIVADAVANGMGSWKFIIGQSIFITVWIIFQFVGIFGFSWDPYPFILLNLLFSTQAAYSAPIIMMAQNRSADRDRAKAEFDHIVLAEVHAKQDLILERLDEVHAMLTLLTKEPSLST